MMSLDYLANCEFEPLALPTVCFHSNKLYEYEKKMFAPIYDAEMLVILDNNKNTHSDGNSFDDDFVVQ